jgi:hypothetical protein
MKPARLRRLFLLSPASTAGRRARILCAPRAGFPLALGVRTPEGAPIGDVFAFLSGLYFRGKLAYARAFAEPDTAIRIITCDRGLVTPEYRVTLADLERMARGSIDPAEPAYRAPLERDADLLAAALGRGAEVVLLGSIATDKYASILQGVFGRRLKFPELFVGRGDMSRGGLLLRAAGESRELSYQSLLGAVRRGKRPARLLPLR